MDINATLKHLRIAPKKVRQVARLLKSMDVRTAEAQLRHLHQKSAGPLLKLLRSCIANAQHNNRVLKDDLYVKLVRVDQGPSLKRQSRTWRNIAHPLLKRTSHVTIVLAVQRGAAASAQDQVTQEKQPKHAKTKTDIRQPRARSARTERTRSIERSATTKTRVFRRKAI